jgi:hypothetical protein
MPAKQSKATKSVKVKASRKGNAKAKVNLDVQPKSDRRSFTVLNSKNQHRLHCKTPAGAARKGLSAMYRAGEVKGAKPVKIQIQETTQGSAKKVFDYVGKREDAAAKVDFNGTKINFKYKYVVKAA